jgi:hypothetical protein
MVSPLALGIIVLPLRYSFPRHRFEIFLLVALLGDKKHGVLLGV